MGTLQLFNNISTTHRKVPALTHSTSGSTLTLNLNLKKQISNPKNDQFLLSIAKKLESKNFSGLRQQHRTKDSEALLQKKIAVGGAGKGGAVVNELYYNVDKIDSREGMHKRMGSAGQIGQMMQ